MGNKWTDAQIKVINTAGKNLLVSAAAGSGKTTVLVARIIKMITDEKNPVDVDRLIVITFTRAAAAQMKQKISDELEKMIEAEPENTLYRRQYRLLSNAAISTIDSFCLNIVRAYFQKLDLDPAFRIADETELKLIKSDCMDELMEKYHEEGNSDFYYLLEAYCGFKSDEKLTQYIYNLANKAESQAWPTRWLDELVKNYEIENAAEFDKSQTAQMVYTHVKDILTGILKKIDEAKNLAVNNDGAPDYVPALEEDGDMIGGALNSAGYSELGEKIRGIKFGRLSTKKSGIPEIKDRIKDERDKYKDSVKSLIKNFYFSDTEEITDTLQKSLPLVRTLCKMTKDYLSLFAEKKREKNVIDFSDAEHFALDILWGETPEALELRKQYSEIIIDEYQDSNNVQEYIANAIAGRCEERPFVFTVGDVKQSIYKFRNACPELFISKQKKYAAEEDNGQLIVLDNNFRSREEVLDSTNAVFGHVMRESLGGIEYNDECSLKKGSDRQTSCGEDSPYKTEVLVISKKLDETVQMCLDADTASFDKVTDMRADSEDKESQGFDPEPDTEDDDDMEVSDNKRILEAELIAHRIKELVFKEKLQVPDEENEGKTRDVKFSDIVILLRTMKDWSSVFSEVMEARGIPVFTDETDGFFKSQEVALVIDFLKILDNPRQDIPFAAVLHSCIGNFNEEELAGIRIACPEAESFYDAALSFYHRGKAEGVFEEPLTAKSGNSTGISEDLENRTGIKQELVNKINTFFSLYHELEDFKQTASVTELIDKIYDMTEVYRYYSVLPDGERRRANLDMLPGYAVKFESTSYSGLFGFIRYYEKLRTKELDYGEAGSKPAGNSVRIMSIHKSKGLEFPVVILAGLGKKFNFDDFKGDICVSSAGGLGIKYVDTEYRLKYPSFYHAVLKMRGTEDIIGEEMRLLYVAMTRAKDKLIMTGYSDNPNSGTDYASLFKAKNFMDFVYPVLEVEKKYFDTAVYSAPTVMKLSLDETGNASGTDFGNGVFEGDTDENIYVAEEDTDTSGPDSYRDLYKKIITASENEYRYKQEEELPVKLSVSDLKHQQIEDEFGENVFEETREFQPGDRTVPDFLKSAETLSKGTDYGTLVHKCMQFIPFDTKTDVREFLLEMQQKNRMSREEADMMPVGKFEELLKSPLADRIRTADAKNEFYREKQFMILLPASEINPAKYGGSDVKIPVQGVIDAMFIEDGGIVILDYKTDRANPGEEDRLIKLYKTQLDVYAEAAERLMGLPVKEKLLYSFSLGKTITV